MLSTLARLFPRPTDWIMETLLVRTQQSPDEPGDPAARDNLYEPKKDGSAEGSQDFAVKRWSLFLQAQKHPLLTAGILGSGFLGAAAARRRLSARSERT